MKKTYNIDINAKRIHIKKKNLQLIQEKCIPAWLNNDSKCIKSACASFDDLLSSYFPCFSTPKTFSLNSDPFDSPLSISISSSTSSFSSSVSIFNSPPSPRTDASVAI
ncbi:hypothetical protein Hanom_Chr03g00264311 [Helianthus anomalus]